MNKFLLVSALLVGGLNAMEGLPVQLREVMESRSNLKDPAIELLVVSDNDQNGLNRARFRWVSSLAYYLKPRKGDLVKWNWQYKEFDGWRGSWAELTKECAIADFNMVKTSLQGMVDRDGDQIFIQGEEDLRKLYGYPKSANE